jgi:hypothetical protein
MSLYYGGQKIKKLAVGSDVIYEDPKEEQTKSVTITSNGVTTITPDAGKTLSSVSVNTSVSGGGLSPGNAVYFKATGTEDWVSVSVTWSTDHYEATPATQPRFIVAVTSDGNEPNVDLSNVTLYVAWISGSTFGISVTTMFTSSNGTAPLVIIV